MKPLQHYQNVQNEMKTWVDESMRPRYHFTAPAGFINDPNGFTVYNGKYQLFYQARYENCVGWGHAESADLVHFTHLPLAIFPGEEYDKDGCWSGCAIEKEGKLYLLYTGQNNATDLKPQREAQCLAYSTDGGVTFTKVKENPVIPPELLTGDASHADFRDPSVWKHGESYYAVVGNSKNSAWKGQAQLFTSSDLIHWQYVGVMYENPNLGGMWECPSFCQVDENTDLLVMSPIDVPVSGHDYHNSRSTVYVIGKLNYETGKFTPRKIGEIDHGKDFYAAQVTCGLDGTPTLIAWMANWEREYKTERPFVGFANNFTLPRRLEIKKDELLQFPAQGVENAFRQTKVKTFTLNGETKADADFFGSVQRLKIKADMQNATAFTLKVFAGGETETTLSYDKITGVLTVDNSKSDYPTKGEERERVREGIRTVPVALNGNMLALDVFLDVNTVEVFAMDGRAAASTMSFNKPDKTQVLFSAEGEVKLQVEKYEFA